MEELTFDSGSITAIPFLGEHADLNIASKAAYLVRVNGHSLLFAADSCNISPSMSTSMSSGRSATSRSCSSAWSATEPP